MQAEDGGQGLRDESYIDNLPGHLAAQGSFDGALKAEKVHGRKRLYEEGTATKEEKVVARSVVHTTINVNLKSFKEEVDEVMLAFLAKGADDSEDVVARVVLVCCRGGL